MQSLGIGTVGGELTGGVDGEGISKNPNFDCEKNNKNGDDK